MVPPLCSSSSRKRARLSWLACFVSVLLWRNALMVSSAAASACFASSQASILPWRSWTRGCQPAGRLFTSAVVWLITSAAGSFRSRAGSYSGFRLFATSEPTSSAIAFISSSVMFCCVMLFFLSVRAVRGDLCGHWLNHNGPASAAGEPARHSAVPSLQLRVCVAS